uniref:Uncharacterized protein n=1 Tax=Arundo donax TaxID=35708 RepID=A0A0A9DVK8_ARUDO
MTETSGQLRFRADWLDFYWQTSLELHIRVCHRNVIAIDFPSIIEHKVMQEESSLYFGKL